MNTNRDRLDDAIDSVAARLTRVDDNDALASQIINALPERVSWFGWLVNSWAPRLAVVALAALAITVVLRTFDERSTPVLRTSDERSTVVRTQNSSQRAVAVSPIVEAASNDRGTIVERTSNDRGTNVERTSNDRRTIAERSSNDRRTLDVPDHERSLPAIGAVAALELDALAPVSLPEDAPLTLAPLAIADLPLTPESISPRE